MTFGPANGTPKQRAVADAAVLVKQFIPPPGAHQRAKSPVPSSPVSSGPQGGGPEDQDVITRTGWWLAPGGPLALLSWEKAHLGKVYRYEGSEENGPGIYSNTYDVPVPGLFDYRHLAVTAVAAGHGQVALRVDALVDWIRPGRRGTSRQARRAVLTETKSVVGTAKAPVANATIVTSAKEVAALAAYLNHLPVNVPGESFSCPGVRATAAACPSCSRLGVRSALAASADLGGCGFLTYTRRHPPAWRSGGRASPAGRGQPRHRLALEGPLTPPWADGCDNQPVIAV